MLRAGNDDVESSRLNSTRPTLIVAPATTPEEIDPQSDHGRFDQAYRALGLEWVRVNSAGGHHGRCPLDDGRGERHQGECGHTVRNTECPECRQAFLDGHDAFVVWFDDDDVEIVCSGGCDPFLIWAKLNLLTVFPYLDENGGTVNVRAFAMNQDLGYFHEEIDDGIRDMVPGVGDRAVFYNLPATLDAVREGKPLYLAGNERLAEDLRLPPGTPGEPVITTVPGGFAEWTPEFSAILAKAFGVCVVTSKGDDLDAVQAVIDEIRAAGGTVMGPISDGTGPEPPAAGEEEAPADNVVPLPVPALVAESTPEPGRTFDREAAELINVGGPEPAVAELVPEPASAPRALTTTLTNTGCGRSAASPLEVFAAAYNRAGGASRIDPGKAQQSVRCPAHDDGRASLSVAVKSDGTLLIKCHAGCTDGGPEPVLDVLGLQARDLFPAPAENEVKHQITEYKYRDKDGVWTFSKFRQEPGKRFWQQTAKGVKSLKGIELVIYDLPEILAAVAKGYPVFVVEGEKDCESLKALGYVATTSPGGAAGGWKSGYTESLTGATEIIILIDNDEPGWKYGSKIAAALRPVVGKISVCRAKEGKDITDHLARGLGMDEIVPVSLDELTAGPGAAESTVVAVVGEDESSTVEMDSGKTLQNLPGRLPDEFWESRDFLRHIRQAAHSRGCSAPLVLYSLLSRMSGMISHHIRAITGIGGPASLNFFAALVGDSGGGKSIAASLVRELMPSGDDDFRDGLPPGSGEGIAEVFMGTVDEPTDKVYEKGPRKGTPVMQKVRKQVRHNAYFYSDEGQALTKLGERSGATLGETLRRAAIGEVLGQTNATEERTRYIPAGSYSFGLLVGFQPEIATMVLADDGTGTPQRFFWGWESDPSIPDTAPPDPGPIDYNPEVRYLSETFLIDFPKSVKDMLWRERIARTRGEVTVARLDAHAGLMKVKAAALFALLSCHPAVTEEDWSLAETLWQSSCTVRDYLVARAQREAEAARHRDENAKVLQAIRIREATNGADLTLERIAAHVIKHASAVGGISKGALWRTFSSRDRKADEADGRVKRAIDLAESRGQVVVEGNTIRVWTG